MKKLVLGVVAAAMMAFAGPAAAETVCTPVGCVSNDTPGYQAVVDGENSNPGPIAGFVSVSDSNQVCADDNGSPDDGDSTNGPESSSPTCTP